MKHIKEFSNEKTVELEYKSKLEKYKFIFDLSAVYSKGHSIKKWKILNSKNEVIYNSNELLLPKTECVDEIRIFTENDKNVKFWHYLPENRRHEKTKEKDFPDIPLLIISAWNWYYGFPTYTRIINLLDINNPKLWGDFKIENSSDSVVGQWDNVCEEKFEITKHPSDQIKIFARYRDERDFEPDDFEINLPIIETLQLDDFLTTDMESSNMIFDYKSRKDQFEKYIKENFNGVGLEHCKYTFQNGKWASSTLKLYGSTGENEDILYSVNHSKHFVIKVYSDSADKENPIKHEIIYV